MAQNENLNDSKASAFGGGASSCDFGMNDTGTSAKGGTELTRVRSPDVLEIAHRDLLVRRNRVGAESQEGRLLSTLIKQLQNYRRETNPTARANLERFMGWTVKAIQRTA